MFCIDYYPFKPKILQADELKIKYNRADRTLEQFLQKYIDKSIIIDTTKSEDFNEQDLILFSAFKEKYNNFKILIDYRNQEILNIVLKEKIPFFFSNFITTIDEVHGLIKYHPTDMYICEQLGFSLDRVSKLLHNNNVKVRVIPNICQSSYPDTPSIKTFFIRPDDIAVYSQYVDVFELFSDQLRVQVIYEIYKKGKWIGQISEIIPSFKQELRGDQLLNIFGDIRLKCKKRCMYNPSSCSMCNLFMNFSNTLKDKNLVLRQVKTEQN